MACKYTGQPEKISEVTPFLGTDGRDSMAGLIRKAVNSFVGTAEQFDDLTMLCVEYKGNDAETSACG